MSDPLISLIKQMDRIVDDATGKRMGGQKLGVFLIIGDADGRADQLRALAKKESLKHLSLCIGNAPPRYEVSKEADFTVVIYTVGRPGRQEVTSNFALRKEELTGVKRDDIVAALSKVLAK